MEDYSTRILKGPILISISIVLFFQTVNSSLFGYIMSFFFCDLYTKDCPDEYKIGDSGECDLRKMCKAGIERKYPSDCLLNWMYTFEPFCSDSIIIKEFKFIAQNCYFIGSGIFPFFLGTLPDKIGRMKAINVAMILALIAGILMFLPNVYCVYIGIFIAGGCEQLYAMTSLIVSEYYHQSITGLVMGIFMAGIPIFCIVILLIFYFARSTKYYFYYYLISQIVCIILMNAFYLESPTWLMANGKAKDCLKYLEKAAKFNGKMEELNEFRGIYQEFIPAKYKKDNEKTEGEEEQEKVQEYTMCDPCKFKSVRKDVIKVGFIWTAILCFDYVVYLNLDNFGGDMYIQGILVYVACLTAAFVSGIFADMFGRKKTLIIYSIIAIVAFTSSPILNMNNLSVPEMVVVFVSAFFIESAFTAILLIAGEIFVPSIRGNANGLMYIVSRLGAIAAPYLVDLLSYPQFYASGFLLISVIPMFLLKETLGLELPNDVEEMIQKKEEEKKEKLNDGGDINRAESTYIPEVEYRETAKDLEENGYIG